MVKEFIYKHRAKLIISLFAMLILFIIILSFIHNQTADGNVRISSEFPASYKPYIDELKKNHPNWIFKALYTNLDWNYVISQENIYGKNLVPKSYTDSWKNTKVGQYNVEVDSGWVDSSKQAVEYAMDPRNFLNYVRIFQFEELSYEASTNTVANIEKILYGTEFYQKIVEYKTASGKNVVMKEKYSDLILKAAKTSKVSAFHLASRIKQEVGPFLSHSSISGTVKDYEGYYNFYNIGATSSSEPMGAIKNGLQYAKDGKGANLSTRNKYLIPWNNKEKAIIGGAIFIGSSYINLGQNTIYLQKFHVTDTNSSGELFWHQYMTNVLAPYSESNLIYNGYSKSGMLNSDISFIVPVYENMPELPCISPAISSSDYTDDNTKVKPNVSDGLNVRSGPSTSYEILTTVTSSEKMTRIAKGKQKGELWDRVKLSNGLVGYVFQNYLDEVKEPVYNKVTGLELNTDAITLQVGEEYTIKAIVIPENANNKKINYNSSNSNLATVNQNGLIVACQEGNVTITITTEEGEFSKSISLTIIPALNEGSLRFKENLQTLGNELLGIEEKTTVEQLLKKIETNYRIEVQNSSGKILTNNEYVGTGSKIKVFEGDKLLIEYIIVLYGDLNGDGKINSIDLLVLQRHILGIKEFSGIFLKAGNTNKSGRKPSSTDLLRIQRHILNIKKINQGT